MRRRHRSFLLILVLVVGGLCLAYSLVFVARGGTLSSLPDAFQRDLQSLAERIRRSPGPAATPRPVPPAAPRTGRLARVDEGPAVRVMFAPATPEAPDGVDDYLLALLNRATHSIDGAFYELGFEPAAQALIAAQQRGATVRLVTDSDYRQEHALQLCIAAGIPVVFDDRKAFMHHKFCVVDRRYVWTGSTNVTDNCLFRNNNNALLITSPELSADFGAEFAEMFERRLFGPRSRRNPPHAEHLVGPVRMECYFSPDEDVAKEIAEELSAAERTVDVLAFSFTSKPLAEAIAARARAGVRVRAVFERRNAGSAYSRDEFLADAGVSVVLDTNPQTMHHKVIIIDGDTVVTGSYNFSRAAEEDNDENCLILHDKVLASAYTQEFMSLFSDEADKSGRDGNSRACEGGTVPDFGPLSGPLTLTLSPRGRGEGTFVGSVFSAH